ncbi:MAG: 50S ribosomal protein L25 [Anaerovorax sp.]|nr:50S ribosomal protein L25 [Anaerovorax sp.]
MSIATLNASIRNEKAKKSRKEGFVPAVVYGKGVPSTPIQFHNKDIIKVIKENGSRTTVKIKLDAETKVGIIKDVHVDPVTSEMQHLDIQLVDRDEIVNWEIPITFSGREQLKLKRLFLETNLSQIKVTGKVSDIPDFINVDVGEKNANEDITIADLNLDSTVKSSRPMDTILAVVKYAVTN